MVSFRCTCSAYTNDVPTEETKAEVSKRGVIAALEKHKERIAGELADRIQTIIDKAKPPKSQSNNLSRWNKNILTPGW